MSTALKLPRPTFDVPVEHDRALLAPAFDVKLERVLVRMRAKGWEPVVYETLRTDQRQAFLYGFGRYYDDDRGIVTHSKIADQTWHKYGLAADIISVSMEWDAPAQFWRDLEQAAEAEGLRSGRDWDGNDATKETFIDSPHVQWAPMRRSPTSEAVRLHAQGGNPAVWHVVGAA